MKSSRQSIYRAFTLLELTIAMMVGMSIGAMIMSLFQLQINFLTEYRRQNFLTEEAPVISAYINKIVGKADSFRIHNSVADALDGSNMQQDASPVLMLNFRQPDGSVQSTILEFTSANGTPVLNYHIVPQPVPLVLPNPAWAVTKKVKNVEFSLVQGILQVTLTGPADEQITYSGTMQK